jgi:hypothetical protein
MFVGEKGVSGNEILEAIENKKEYLEKIKELRNKNNSCSIWFIIDKSFSQDGASYTSTCTSIARAIVQIVRDIFHMPGKALNGIEVTKFTALLSLPFAIKDVVKDFKTLASSDKTDIDRIEEVFDSGMDIISQTSTITEIVGMTFEGLQAVSPVFAPLTGAANALGIVAAIAGVINFVIDGKALVKSEWCKNKLNELEDVDASDKEAVRRYINIKECCHVMSIVATAVALVAFAILLFASPVLFPLANALMAAAVLLLAARLVTDSVSQYLLWKDLNQKPVAA